MANLSLRHINKIYDNKVQAVFDFNLEIQDKEFIVLVGPSGCGKSTTLRMIAGLEDITNGELYIDDKLVNDVAPKNREIAMVFQSYALYPFMTVYENMAFGLQIRKTDKDEIDRRVRAAAKALEIEQYLDRKPKALSGGQRQRVALGRAIVRNAKVFLMDEPLSNLDAKLRLEMRYELQRLHVETGSTFVYVTHDQMEAMTLSTKICLMNNGLLQQYDYPLSLYNKPNNLFCADFVGNPSVNFLEAKGKQNQDGTFTFTVLDNKTAVFTPEHNFNMQEWFEHRDAEKHSNDLDEKSSTKVEKENKDEVFKYHIQKVNEDYISDDDVIITNEDFILGIRPEKITVDVNGKLDAAVDGSMPTGMESTLKLNINNYLLTSVIFGNQSFVIGDQVHITVLPYDILLYDRKSGKLIASGSVTIQ